MIFGGIVPIEENKKDDEHNKEKIAQYVATTNNCYYLNVTNGTIKRGPELMKPSFYISGGNMLSYANKVYAFGFASNKEFN